jgi:hypothetical protein
MKLPTLVRVTSLVLSIAACSMAPGAQQSPSAAPLASAEPTAAAASPAVAPTAESTLRPPLATDAPPPRGLLRGDADAVEGWPGSYCWHGTCADAAAVPSKDQLPSVVGGGDDLDFSLSGGATFVRWRATYADDSDDSPTTLGQGGEGFDPDANPSGEHELLSAVTFGSPPSGDWVVFVQVFFEAGDLSYAWHVIDR